MSRFTQLTKANPTLINDVIEGVNAAAGAATGEEKMDMAAATVISIAGAVFPQGAAFEGLAFSGLKALIQMVYNAKNKKALSNNLQSSTPTATTAQAQAAPGAH